MSCVRGLGWDVLALIVPGGVALLAGLDAV